MTSAQRSLRLPRSEKMCTRCTFMCKVNDRTTHTKAQET